MYNKWMSTNKILGKWEIAVKEDLEFLNKRVVFVPNVQTPKCVSHEGFKWVFIRKQNEKNKITRYKARFVAQDFLHKPRIDYERWLSLEFEFYLEF